MRVKSKKESDSSENKLYQVLMRKGDLPATDSRFDVPADAIELCMREKRLRRTCCAAFRALVLPVTDSELSVRR